jgi:hypothetical protein
LNISARRLFQAAPGLPARREAEMLTSEAVAC